MKLNNTAVHIIPKSIFTTDITIQLFIWALLVLFVFLPSASNAGVTVFDENKGVDVPAELQGGDLERLLEIKRASRPKPGEPIVKKTKKKRPPLFKKVTSPSDIVLLPWETENYDLGHAQIFVDGGKFSKEIAAKIFEFNHTEGLRVSYYLKFQEDFNDLRNFVTNGLLFMGSVEFETDTRNRKFKALGMRNYMTVHYTSPFGETRIFPLDNTQYIINKIAEMKIRVRGE